MHLNYCKQSQQKYLGKTILMVNTRKLLEMIYQIKHFLTRNSSCIDERGSCFKEEKIKNVAKNFSEDRFPNVFILFKIGCTLPATFFECEIIFSPMRRFRDGF